MELAPDTPVQYVPRVGPSMAGKLARLGIQTVRDLLWYAPFRYDDYSQVVPIAAMHIGQTVSVRGTVLSVRLAFTKTGKRMTEAVIGDASGSVTAIWFNQPYLAKTIPTGSDVSLSGRLEFFGNRRVMPSPDYELVRDDGVLLSTGRIVPVYSETEGLTSKWLRGRIAFVLDACLPAMCDPLPENERRTLGLVELTSALRDVHFPRTLAAAAAAKHRIAFDELLTMHLLSGMERIQWRTTRVSPSITTDKATVSRIASGLPFTLTADQQRAVDDILADMSRPYAMNRLLEGDVGSGKTVVAAIAMYAAAQRGFQSALMAPTQVLADQHYRTVSSILGPLGIRISLVTGAVPKRARGGERPDVVIGTHAILEGSTEFDALGLTVIDEQQRFGVRARGMLRAKSGTCGWPHLLSMTATPIPRTLALTLYGNLDVSRLENPPTGRKPIKTWVVPPGKRNAAYEWIRTTISKDGTGAFVVCPFIEESESMTGVKAATKEFTKLKESIFPDIPTYLLHGKMKPAEKDAVLAKFRDGGRGILVATPVVEVGIDIPRATVMVIEAAERFGLSQLHQLRGRVGRSDLASYCLLFTDATDEATITRLKALETTNSGPKLADLDLELRGPGDMYGTRQHGVSGMVLASLTDTDLVTSTRELSERLLAISPTLSDFPPLRETVNRGTIRNIAQD